MIWPESQLNNDLGDVLQDKTENEEEENKVENEQV